MVAIVRGAYLQMKPAQRNKSLKEGEKEGQSRRREYKPPPPNPSLYYSPIARMLPAQIQEPLDQGKPGASSHPAPQIFQFQEPTPLFLSIPVCDILLSPISQ